MWFTISHVLELEMCFDKKNKKEQEMWKKWGW